ncbi:hypothetical protein PHMEG_0003512, partial [Phytophthora megakarya]
MSTQINDGSCDFFTHPKPFFESDCHHPVPVTIDELPHPENEVSVRVGRKYCRWRAKTKRVNKYCTTHGCGNISVSRGLCRGHGGGRRCHFAGCAKGAQSCSIFCWAHGGGCRCEVKGCMRSRKSKHFCVDHVKLECTIPTMAIPQALEVPKTTTSASTTQSGSPPHTPQEIENQYWEMVPQLCPFVPPGPSDTKTISISIRRGCSGRSSSIMLPREHVLARHLERLVSYETSQPKQPVSQQPLNYDVVGALSSVVQYIHANNASHEAPDSSIAALFNSLLPPSDHVKVSVINKEASRHRLTHPESCRRTRSTKHCKMLGCGNISVSRGLCRGHGGGRRCHHIGCTKSAQSRSVFCWSHGGGRRCEVESCKRSRKSKRFCADHVHLEQPITRKGGNVLKMILNDADED